MTADRLRQIHAVTDNFFFWQGLRWIPMGVALLGCAVVSSPRWPLPAAVRAWSGVPLFAVALWLSTSVLGRYYARHFGCVRGDPSRHVTRTSIKWLVAYPGFVVAMVVDVKLGPPVVISSLGFALAIEAYRQSTGGGRRHYIIAALGLIAFSILPAFGVVPPGKDALAPLVGMIGFIYIVGGLLDHRELVRVLAPMPEKGRVAPV